MLTGIKSKLILKKIFGLMEERLFYEILRHNKELQSRCDLTFEDYELGHREIEIEIKVTGYSEKETVEWF